MSLPVDLGRGKHRTESEEKIKPTLDLNKRWEYIKCFFLMKGIGDVQSGSSCAVHKHGGGKKQDTSSKQSGRERFNRGLGWTCHRVDFSWLVLVLLG